MKKILILFFTLFSLNFSAAQVLQWRLLEVAPENMEEFMAAAAKKTKMYNSKEGQPRYLTYRILTGPNAQNLVRFQIADSIQELDLVDTKGNNYWQKTTGSLHTSKGNSIWVRSVSGSHIPEDAKRVDHRRIIFYNYKDEGEADFWRFRERVSKAMKASGYEQWMSVFYCSSGCDGNWVQVRFHHDGFSGERSDYGAPLKKMIEKYDELYGTDAYEQDSNKVDQSLIPNGRKIRHHQLMPELSSPRRSK
jgi:hypothetical protein